MTLEQYAARMTRFLAAKPKRKTAAYIETLPKRDRIVVSPLDYVACSFERARMADAMNIKPVDKAAQLAGDKARYAAWEARGCPPSPSLPLKRKDKIRPSVRDPYYQSLMVRMVLAQGGVCFLCGDALDTDNLPANSPMRASFDHVVPVSLGGENIGNRMAAHRDCNGRKGNRRPYACELLFLSVVNIYVDTVHGAVKAGA